ncbi:MAG: hypothetical protein D6722_28625 [Bacteroidetes bacterium]|nr:MAG: hypothetical protein D6722_28625 [Bacteroidota bacterium]
MNPDERGWLKKFLAYRRRLWRAGTPPASLADMAAAPSSYHFLYQQIQPTGLMYGHPVAFVSAETYPTVEEWSERDKIKILLAESYLTSGLYHHFPDTQEPRLILDRSLKDIRHFYTENHQLYGKSPRTLFGRSQNLTDQIEYFLDHRIQIRYDWRNFWTTFFHNSLVFFDLALFAQWQNEPSLYTPDILQAEREGLRMNILRVIAAAAQSDGEVEAVERELFNYFLHSANLPGDKKREAAGFLQADISLETIDLHPVRSWLLKKYYLELAILTTWANRHISEAERLFLRQLTDKLDLQEQDLRASMEAIERFVVAYWGQVHYLQVKHNSRIVSERLIRRMQQAVRRNQRLIAQEIRESRELVQLLAKSRREELSPAERERVRRQLLDILKSIPAFAFLLLPGAFFTLPILLRIIPKSILYPSSFRANELPDD